MFGQVGQPGDQVYLDMHWRFEIITNRLIVATVLAASGRITDAALLQIMLSRPYVEYGSVAEWLAC